MNPPFELVDTHAHLDDRRLKGRLTEVLRAAREAGVVHVVAVATTAVDSEPVLAMADYIGSTTSLLKYAVSSPAKEFIVVTESGILHQMQKQAPDKTFIAAPPDANCACNECPFMKMNTLEKVYLSLRDLQPRIEMAPELMERARRPIDRMLALS